MSDARMPRVTRPTWVWGGALLIAGTVLSLTPYYAFGGGWIGPAGVVLVSGAWLIFAVGRDRVVQHRLGVVALFVLGIWPVLSLIAWPLILNEVTGAAPVPEWVIVVGYVDSLIPVAAATIATVDVLRGDRVAARLRRLPLIALALCVIPAVLSVVVTTAVKTPDQNLYGVLFGLALLCRLAALIGLGVVAIVAGLQPRPSAEASVQVFPPADPDLRARPTD